GAAHLVGKLHSRSGSLIIDDQAQRTPVRARLDGAWKDPEAVTDPRVGALVDIMRNVGQPFSIRDPNGQGLEPVLHREWYPPELQDTIEAILTASMVLTSGSAP